VRANERRRLGINVYGAAALAGVASPPGIPMRPQRVCTRTGCPLIFMSGGSAGFTSGAAPAASLAGDHP
jgi:hypothetical protein